MPLVRRHAPHLALAILACVATVACDDDREHSANDVAAAAPAPQVAEATEVAERNEVPEGPERPERPEAQERQEIKERPEQPERPEASERSASSNTTFTEGRDGSVSITTRNGTLVMSLRHDSIVVAFSDSMRNAVQGEVKKSMKEDAKADADENSALGQMIKGVVQSTVKGALHEVFEKSRGFPVSAVRDVSYEDGAIKFSYVKKPTWNFDKINSDDEPLLAQFHPADAARFVGAVRSHINR